MTLIDGKGFFITFEGGEGSGKSTQIEKLVHFLKQSSLQVIKTREPGGCESAEILRDLIVKSQKVEWHYSTELLLILASRLEHLSKVILPSLEQNISVVCDRFSDSTYAYQGYARGMNLDFIKSLHQMLQIDIKPYRTYLLDIQPEIGLQRSKKRLIDGASSEHRFEDLDLEFHYKIYKGFHELAKQEPKRFCIIDATLSPDDVHDIIKEDIKKLGIR